MRMAKERMLLRAKDECGSVHRWWIEHRAGWHFLHGPKPWLFGSWELPKGYTVDLVKFPNDAVARLFGGFCIRIKKEA